MIHPIFAGNKIPFPHSIPSPSPRSTPQPLQPFSPNRSMKSRSKSAIEAATGATTNKYLKPGALALLRNSKISARSHNILLRRVNSLVSSLPSTSPTTQIPIGGSSTAQMVSFVAQIESLDQLPDFPPPVHGPRSIRRKRLIAGKSSVFAGVNVGGSGPGRVWEASPGSPFVSAVNSDLLVH